MKYKNIILILLIGLIVLSFGVFIYADSSNTKLYKTGDVNKLVLDYLSFVKNFDRNNRLIYAENPGMSEIVDLTPNISIDEAENMGIFKGVRSRLEFLKVFNCTIENQREVILREFGDKAFNNISYELIESESNRSGYMLAKTGEVISKEEYEELNYAYWSEIASKESVKYSDLFLEDNEPLVNISQKRSDIVFKYKDNMPAKYGNIVDGNNYKVRLSFDGIIESENGYCDFCFFVRRESGEWHVSQGITWNVIYSDVESD